VIDAIERKTTIRFPKRSRIAVIRWKALWHRLRLGTTGWRTRKDLAGKYGLAEPKTWSEYTSFVARLYEATGKPVLLPGGDPFFIDQLFAELVANNGGVLFDTVTFRPLANERAGR